MRKPTLSLLAPIVSIAMLSSVQGAVLAPSGLVISLNWRGANTFEGTLPSNGTTFAGAVRRAWWTSQTLTDSAPVTTSNLIDDNGNATSALVTIDIDDNAEPHNGQPNYSGPNDDLLVLSTGKGVRGQGAGNTLYTITGEDVPYMVYDVYVYLADRPPSAGFEMRLVLNGEERFIQTPDDDINFFLGNGFVEVEVMADPTPGNYTVGNYVVFRGVSVPDFTITVDSTSTLDGGNRMAVTGMQIVAVPEPSAMAFLGLGILGLVGCRRRR